VTGADLQFGPKKFDRLSWPDTFKHDEVAFQVPSTSPPHAATLEQEAVVPSLPEEPAAAEPLAPADAPLPAEPLVPAEPGVPAEAPEVPLVEVQPAIARTNEIAA
jgi:hypothetical protein